MGGQQEWFDNDCKTKRDEFYIDLNKYRSNKNEENRNKMCSTRSEYKKLLRKKRFEARRANTDKFIDARLSN